MATVLGKQLGQDTVSRDLCQAGLDIIHWFWVDDANQRLDQSQRIPDCGAAGLLVGNTKALWEPLSRWWRTHPTEEQPLDTYVQQVVSAALRPLRPTWTAYAHELLPAPLPIQKHAEAIGLAGMSPVGLSLHPAYGPWFALRAVAVFDATNLTPSPRAPVHHCDACHRPCLAPFRLARASSEQASARRYLPVRQACPIGAQHAYGKEQTDYHYERTLPEWLNAHRGRFQAQRPG